MAMDQLGAGLGPLCNNRLRVGNGWKFGQLDSYILRTSSRKQHHIHQEKVTK